MLLFNVGIVSNVNAGVGDFASFFDMDLEKDKLPTMEELYLLMKKHEVYNRKYDSYYDLLGDFDEEFKNVSAVVLWMRMCGRVREKLCAAIRHNSALRST